MNHHIDPDQWVFIAVEKTAHSEQIVAQHDTENDIRFIPTFLNRRAAQDNAGRLRIGDRIEIQAILYEDLLVYAGESQTMVFVSDEKGTVLAKIAPDGTCL